jgi:hypothetical protein
MHPVGGWPSDPGQRALLAWNMQGDTLGLKGHFKVTDGHCVLSNVTALLATRST